LKDAEVVLNLTNTISNRRGEGVSAQGVVSIGDIDVQGEHGFADYLIEYGFIIKDELS